MEKCKFCPKEAKSKAGLAAHMRSHKEDEMLESESSVKPVPEEKVETVEVVSEENQKDEVPSEMPDGIVGGGHAVPEEPKKAPESPRPVDDGVVFTKGDRVMDVFTGNRFVVHAVEGERVARQVNQAPDGIKWYDRTSLTKL